VSGVLATVVLVLLTVAVLAALGGPAPAGARHERDVVALAAAVRRGAVVLDRLSRRRALPGRSPADP
jgi:hypothetical protein